MPAQIAGGLPNRDRPPSFVIGVTMALQTSNPAESTMPTVRGIPQLDRGSAVIAGLCG